MPDQLDGLIDAYGRDKMCLAAAELDLQELMAAKVELEERLAYAERTFKSWQTRTDASYSAVRRRIDAQTETALSDEIVKARCCKALMVNSTTQFLKSV